MAVELTVHPFEQAGLGKAPFRVVGVEERRGPLTSTTPDGITLMVGSPGQPMGICDFCGTCIAECWQIRSADGKQFIVGCDCVRKTGDRVLIDPMRRELNRRNLAARHERDAARIAATKAQVAQDGALRDRLASLPHPYTDRAARGETWLGWAEWMLMNAGTSGCLKVARFIDGPQCQDLVVK